MLYCLLLVKLDNLLSWRLWWNYYPIIITILLEEYSVIICIESSPQKFQLLHCNDNLFIVFHIILSGMPAVFLDLVLLTLNKYFYLSFLLQRVNILATASKSLYTGNLQRVLPQNWIISSHYFRIRSEIIQVFLNYPKFCEKSISKKKINNGQLFQTSLFACHYSKPNQVIFLNCEKSYTSWLNKQGSSYSFLKTICLLNMVEK